MLTSTPIQVRSIKTEIEGTDDLVVFAQLPARCQCCGAEVEGGDIVGVVVNQYVGEGEVSSINSLWVAETHRRQGIGRQMLQHALDYCRKVKAHMLTVQACEDNLVSQALYESMGFERGIYADREAYKGYSMEISPLDEE